MWHTHLYTSLYWSHLYSESRPTNHLSAEGCGFLEDTLRSAAGVSLVLVSHDRGWDGSEFQECHGFIVLIYPVMLWELKGQGGCIYFFLNEEIKNRTPESSRLQLGYLYWIKWRTDVDGIKWIHWVFKCLVRHSEKVPFPHIEVLVYPLGYIPWNHILISLFTYHKHQFAGVYALHRGLISKFHQNWRIPCPCESSSLFQIHSSFWEEKR